MIKRIAFVFTMFAVAALAADPTLVGLVMPDAKILTGIQVDRSQASPFGQYVLAQTQFNDPGFLKFVAETGFDPRHDLREIVAATDGDKGAIVLGRGTFQPSKIAAAAVANGGSAIKYKGFDVILTDKTGSSAIAIVDGSIGLFGNQAAVQAAIDRKVAGVVFGGALAQKAQMVSASNHAWFVTLTPISEFMAGKTLDSPVSGIMNNNLMAAIQSASGGLTFGTSTITVAAEAVTRSDKDAQALNDVLKFLVGMMQGGGSQGGVAGAAANLANSVQISTEGATLKISLSLPQSQAEQLFMGAPGPKGATPKRKAAAVR